MNEMAENINICLRDTPRKFIIVKHNFDPLTGPSFGTTADCIIIAGSSAETNSRPD